MTDHQTRGGSLFLARRPDPALLERASFAVKRGDERDHDQDQDHE